MNDKTVEFLTALVKDLTDFPNDVQVEKTVDEMGVLLTLNVNPEDMGKIIGRKGATAKSIRTLLRVVGMKNNSRVNMKISEPLKEGGEAHVSMEPTEVTDVSSEPMEREAD